MALQRILCVDDDPDIRTLLEIGLSAVGGFEVRLCGSGCEAMAALGNFRPDLVILDVMMPEMDGPRAMRALRECRDGLDCPVVFLTAAARPGEARRLAALGAAAVIAKPFDPMTLADEIRTVQRRMASYRPGLNR